MTSIRMFKACGDSICQLKRDIKLNNVMLGSVNINFNGSQIFDAWMHHRFYHKSYDH